MYAKCGALSKAQEVFHGLPIRTVSTWNALLAGYVQQGLGKEALDRFCQMQSELLVADAFTYSCALKACGITKDIDLGKEIHDEIVTQGLLGNNPVLGTALVDMYAKCNSLDKAHQVLDDLPVRNVVSWSALIYGYIQQGQSKEAMACYDQMQEEGICPDAMTYACVLKACGIAKEPDKGKQIHEEITCQGLLGKDVVLSGALVDMYANCGLLTKARQVLHDLSDRDTVSWSSLIAGYTQRGQGEAAMDCFEQMREEGLSPNMITYACILKACGITQESTKGKQIHEEIVNQGLLETDVVLGSALVDMYAQCGLLTNARQVLDKLPVRDTVSWSALIAGHTRQGQGEEAIDCYEQMQLEGLCPNAMTYACILKSCGIVEEVEKGKQIHEAAASKGFLGNDADLGIALVDMYIKCGVLEKAQQVHDELSIRSVVSWSALIAGYAQQGRSKEAMACYNLMRYEGLSPEEITYTSILKACGIAKELDKGKQFHEEIASQGLLKRDVMLGTALVDMYAKCGVLAKSRQVLDELHVRDVVSWNALIAGYAEQEQCEKVMMCYEEMQQEGLSPDTATYLSILMVCGLAKDVDTGKRVHEDIACLGLLREHASALGKALIDMYAKCGLLTIARQVLDELPVRHSASWSALMAAYAQEGWGEETRDCIERMQSEGLVPGTVSWNLLIRGYARQGEIEKALVCFDQMQHKGISPDATTLGSMLNACGDSGLVVKGQMIFENMEEQFGITPNIEHHVFMVDLFGHVGYFDKAMALIEKLLPYAPLAVWSALLGACRKWGNIKLGRLAFEHAVQIDERDAMAYICMEDIYVAARMPEEAQEVECMRVKNCCMGAAVMELVG